MRKIVGVGVSAGIAIGIVKILSANDHAVERRVVDDSQEEVARFRKAQDAACQQLKTLRDKTAAEFGEGKAELFDAHQLMLRDPDYVESIESMISGNKVNAEFAVNSTAEQFAAMFVAMDNSYMQVRAVDIKDVSKRLLNVLEGKTTGEGNDDGVPISSSPTISPRARPSNSTGRRCLDSSRPRDRRILIPRFWQGPWDCRRSSASETVWTPNTTVRPPSSMERPERCSWIRMRTCSPNTKERNGNTRTICVCCRS